MYNTRGTNDACRNSRADWSWRYTCHAGKMKFKLLVKLSNLQFLFNIFQSIFSVFQVSSIWNMEARNSVVISCDHALPVFFFKWLFKSINCFLFCWIQTILATEILFGGLIIIFSEILSMSENTQMIPSFRYWKLNSAALHFESTPLLDLFYSWSYVLRIASMASWI